MKKPSAQHANRRHYNWLVYDIGDKQLEQDIPFYKGALFDLGCGEAPYKEFFLQYADSYTGVDWSSCTHNSKADIIADLNKPLPLESNIADTVISLSVMEHLCEPQTMLNEAYRILKPNGMLLLQVPWQWWIHEAPHDYFRYTPFGLKYMFEKAGFSSIEIEPQSGFFTMWLTKLNYFTRRFIKGPRPIRFLIQLCLLPFWYFNQLIAPLLDKLDKNWLLESSGYRVRAVKK